MSTLVPYGIHTEASDLRIHVCVAAARMYVFRTASARRAIATNTFPTRPAFTGSQQTASGYLVPPSSIDGCLSVAVPQIILDRVSFKKTDSTSAKGKKAAQLVELIARHFGLPMPVDVREVTNHAQQIAGVDMIATLPAQRIQIKCDWDGGNKEHGGSGNLFLQFEEINPLHQT
jgi:hypothetical protein